MAEETEHIAPGEDIRFQRTSFFEIYGTESNSLRAWRQLAVQVEEVIGQYLQLPRQFPHRIIILLRDADEFEENEIPYRKEERSGGRVFVEVGWDHNLSEATARRLLVDAFLWRWARWQRISFDDADNSPEWLREALVLESAIRGDISWRAGIMDYLQTEGPFSISDLLSPAETEDFSRKYRYSSALLLRYLHAEGRQSRFLEAYLLRYLRGEDAVEALLAVFGDRMGSEENLELWWLTGATEMIWNRARGIQRASTTSLDWQEQSRLLFVDKQGERKEFFLSSWWEQREDPMVRFLLERRLQRISLELEQIHPFYFNAFLGLGRFIDAVLTGEEDRAQQLLQEMEEDYAAGDRLRREMREVLDQWESRAGE
ncbi:MAG: hypothetical protein JJT75_04940 [Opitutales bacterium]|nr:hypothetical protein [Opitutales bacterium]MCH8540562.1 hypothetical protein [Opitutales bacterium]